MLYTGPYARDEFNKEKDLSEWKNVFVLLRSGIKKKANGRSTCPTSDTHS